MCGRYVSAASPQEIADYFGATSVTEALAEPVEPEEQNFNVAPTVSVPALRHRAPSADADPEPGDRHLDLFRWGLIPSWAKSKNIGAKMINARSETVTTKNAFRAAAKRRRCIIPADAFYEWTAVTNPDGGKPKKQPWCIQRVDGDPFAFAGLYETWRDPDAPEDAPRVLTCTILTRGANEAITPIHDRMPVMLAPHRWDDWIDRGNEDITELLASIETVPSELLEIYPVSTAVNNSRSRGAELMNLAEPLGEDFSWSGSAGRVPAASFGPAT
ncbi:MAG: SOS response-associated peptidase [Actinomycetota bacterium]